MPRISIPNLVVIRSPDIHRAVPFYRELGLVFELHSHGTGPEHYAASANGFVFEIYPARSTTDTTVAVRIGFQVQTIDDLVRSLSDLGATILKQPDDSQ